jgi:hypothetical protein
LQLQQKLAGIHSYRLVRAGKPGSQRLLCTRN